MLGIVVVMLLGSVSTIVGVLRSEGLLINGYHAEFLLQAMQSDAMTFAISIAVVYAVSALFLTPMEAVSEKDAVSMNYFGGNHGKSCSVLFLGAFWVLIGMLFALSQAAAIWYMHRRLWYIMCLLCFYFNTLCVLYPKEWIAPSEQWLYGNTGVIIFLIELIWLAAIGCGERCRTYSLRAAGDGRASSAFSAHGVTAPYAPYGSFPCSPRKTESAHFLPA